MCWHWQAEMSASLDWVLTQHQGAAAAGTLRTRTRLPPRLPAFPAFPPCALRTLAPRTAPAPAQSRCATRAQNTNAGGLSGLVADSTRVSFVGHSFGGATALLGAELDERVARFAAVPPSFSNTPYLRTLPSLLSFYQKGARVLSSKITRERSPSVCSQPLRTCAHASARNERIP